jgi:Flp pilus assembly protein TadG
MTIQKNILNNERGVSMILIALLLTMFMGFIALAIEFGHLYVVRNELRDAADAGALAGARVLYTTDGTAVNPGANDVAKAAATANLSEKAAVEVSDSNVERGHWSFTQVDANGNQGVFTPNSSLTALALWNYTTQELDTNTDFINAVRVTARRQSSPSIVTYFAGLFGISQFVMQQKAVAWLGYASGTIPPQGVDQPLAICENSIFLNGKLTCNVGRTFNSSGSSTTNTAGWTNYSQPPNCSAANANDVRNIIGNDCSGGNDNALFTNLVLGTTNGVVDNVFSKLYSCWKTATSNSPAGPNIFWPLKLLVIECPSSSITPCNSKIKGVVKLNVIWMVDQAKTNGANAYDEAPLQMSGKINGVTKNWVCSTPSNLENCWNEFVSENLGFNLKAPSSDSNSAPYSNKQIYFLPACDYEEPTGGPGGNNYGVLSRQPRLVDWDNPYSKF